MRRRDLTVYPNTQIARLPAPLRPLALLARNVLPKRLRMHRYAYRSIDVATSNFSPFLHDPAFGALYQRVAVHWSDGGVVDIRWRLWILTRLAAQRRGSEGAFAEFGVFRGGCAFMILSTAELPRTQRYHLFDTFTGVPESRLAEEERRVHIGGDFADTSTAAVAALLKPWAGQVDLHAGDVFETADTSETGPLGFVHIDLNASAPTVRALEYAYARMVPGAIIVLDDYGQYRYAEQRRRIDEFFDARPESVVALPTGQALVIKA